MGRFLPAVNPEGKVLPRLLLTESILICLRPLACVCYRCGHYIARRAFFLSFISGMIMSWSSCSLAVWSRTLPSKSFSWPDYPQPPAVRGRAWQAVCFGKQRCMVRQKAPQMLEKADQFMVQIHASVSVLSMSWFFHGWFFSRLISMSWFIHGWFFLELTGLSSLQSKGLSWVFSSTTIQKHQFFSIQPSLWSNFHIHLWLLEKP